MKGYITVGDFSKRTGLTPKALRIYDRGGLLKPAWVDGDTRYRYYLPSQISDAIRIKLLRNLGVSLDGIRHFMNEHDPERVNAFLAEQALAIRQQIRERERNLLFLDQLMRDRDTVFLSYHIGLREIPAQRVVSIREIVLKEEFDLRVMRLRRVLSAYLGEAGERATGSSFALLHHEEFSPPKYYELELCLPVRAPVKERGDIRCREVEGGVALATLHKGSYETILGTYGVLLRWIEAHSYTPLLPMREIYLTDPDRHEPASYRTEILWPVKEQ